MDGGRGWAEFGPSLTIIRCCLHPFFTPYAFLFASHYPPSIDSTLIQIDRVKRVYVTRVWRRVNRSKIDRVAKYRNFFLLLGKLILTAPILCK